MTSNGIFPKISIVTPSFNQAQFLERTIQSILDQGYPNLEYIIMDGGSTDGSVDIIKKYADQLAHWISEPDKGQADAIRKGFEKATGEIFAWLNSDDTYEPGALFKVAKAFQDYPDADLIFGDYWWIDEEDKKIVNIKHPEFDFETYIYVGGSLHQTAAFWTREIYNCVGGINSKYEFCMDFDLFCRIGENGVLIHIPEYLSNFRAHSGAKSSRLLDIAEKEHNLINQSYISLNQPRWAIRLIQLKCEMKRVYNFFAQGEFGYVMKGVRKRMYQFFGR